MGISANQYGITLFIDADTGQTRHDQTELPKMNLMQARKAAEKANESAPKGWNYCAYNINAE